MKFGRLELTAGKPVVAVSFTDADGADDIERARLAGVGIAELRIDHFARLDAAYVTAQARRLHGLPTLATIRLAEEGGKWTGTPEARIALYQDLLPLVDAIDVELRASETLEAVVPLAKAEGRPVVVSHHDFDRTPPYEELLDVARRAVAFDADIVKIAAHVASDADIETLSRLLDEKAAPALVVIGMGEMGMPTRLLFPRNGSLFTFAAQGERSSAPGQMPYDRMLKMLAGLYPAA